MADHPQEFAGQYTGNDPSSLIKGAEHIGDQDPLRAAMLMKYAVAMVSQRIDALFRAEKLILSEELYRSPDNPLLLLRLAAVCENSGEIRDAIEVYDKIIRLHDEPGLNLAPFAHDRVVTPEKLDELVNLLSNREAQLVCFARGQREILENQLNANSES